MVFWWILGTLTLWLQRECGSLIFSAPPFSADRLWRNPQGGLHGEKDRIHVLFNKNYHTMNGYLLLLLFSDYPHAFITWRNSQGIKKCKNAPLRFFAESSENWYFRYRAGMLVKKMLWSWFCYFKWNNSFYFFKVYDFASSYWTSAQLIRSMVNPNMMHFQSYLCEQVKIFNEETKSGSFEC